jgi:O-acetyl-ADP-ribose deacetylase (regulator of RNase III)
VLRLPELPASAVNRIEIMRGDITRLDVDAIVNAANERMLGGGGVDGAIHRAAGPELLAACRRIPEVRPGVRCLPGEARITDGFHLPSRYVIHTVGPVWRGGGSKEPELLASCYRSSLRLAVDHDIRSIAFPAISTGVYGYPLGPACAIALSTTLGFLEHDRAIDRVVFVGFGDDAAAALRAAYRQTASP